MRRGTKQQKRVQKNSKEWNGREEMDHGRSIKIPENIGNFKKNCFFLSIRPELFKDGF